MSAPVLTAKAYCLEVACGWACEGEPGAMEKAAVRHGKTLKHGTATWVHNPQAPVRTPKETS